MNHEKYLKNLVREKYSEIAHQKNKSSCCSVTCGCLNTPPLVMAEDYTHLNGYMANADLGLGCGLPTEFAQIKPGDTVVDLGSGAGNDCFVAQSIVGATGLVIGIDMTEAMLEKARANADQRKLTNVEFRLGDIENIPIDDNTADVVISNCVMNLVPNKSRAFAETFRILKQGGHFSISDIVLQGELPANLREAAILYTGCISGAIQKDEYLNIIKATGFIHLTLQKERQIELPDEMLNQYLSAAELQEFRENHRGIVSITVFAEKPLIK